MTSKPDRQAKIDKENYERTIRSLIQFFPSPAIREHYFSEAGFPDCDPEILDDNTKFQAWLRSLDANKFAELADAVRARNAAAREYSFSFNKTAANADFDHWGKVAFWTIDEAVALSFGKDPDHVSWSSVGDDIDKHDFPKTYRKRYDLVQRAADARSCQISEKPSPREFMEWARIVSMELPDELVSAVGDFVDWRAAFEELQAKTTGQTESHKRQINALAKERGALADQLKDWDDVNSRAQSPQTKEIESMLKLIIGMAVSSYGFVPNDKRGLATSKIKSALTRAGVSLDDQTILKFLRQASELLPAKE